MNSESSGLLLSSSGAILEAMNAPDFDLLRAWAGGDQSAGTTLFERYYPTVIRFFRNKVGGAAQDDLVQQTFLRCVRASGTAHTVVSFRAYLLRVAYTTLVDHLREEARIGRRLVVLTPDELDAVSLDELSANLCGRNPELAFQRREADRVLLKALRRLPLPYQMVLELHYWEGLTGEEVAAVISIPLGTVKTRIRKGRRRLRDEIQSLATSPEAIRSTLDSLESWARRIGARARGAGPWVAVSSP